MTTPPLPGFLNSLAGPLNHFGLWAVLLFVLIEDIGIPVPGETILIAASVYAGTGLCGGLSTFSTMQAEILKMLDAGAWALAAGYTAASVAAGYAAIHLATAMVRRVRVRG